MEPMNAPPAESPPNLRRQTAGPLSDFGESIDVIAMAVTLSVFYEVMAKQDLGECESGEELVNFPKIYHSSIAARGGYTCCEKLDTSSSGWHKTMTEVLSKIKGVSYTIDAQAGIAHVSGTIDPDTLMKLLAQSRKHAELLRVNSGYKHQFYTAKLVAIANYRNGQ
ncbi:unnamed protein product [Prunus armeniaca]|uniref:HMA domain-containing protein n=1 Tax=Prunus armeniaca TaxID=36596 RepID=A0A6J5WCP3_PRUAR|nr:unnamed protein product [Prunus armeniaca]